MTRAEWIELAAIGGVAAASWPARPWLPAALPLWQIVLGLSALLLAQSLVRDVAILLRRRRAKSSETARQAQCFCLESTAGATGVVAGALLIGSALQIEISRWELSLALAVTMILGFLIKDFVISWNPIGVRREKNHVNLFVRLKRK